MKWFLILFALLISLNLLAAAASHHSTPLQISPVTISAPVVTERDLISAHVAGADDESVVRLEFSPTAAKRLQEYTAAHLGEKLAFVVDHEIVKTPVIRAAITGDSLEVSYFDHAQAVELAKKLNR
jgi:preprotein translocase subunit SecD